MADRGANAATIAELGAAQNRPVHLVSVETDGGTVYINDSYKTLTYLTNDYLGVGLFLGFSDIEETATLQISSLTLTLSGVDQSIVSLFLNNNYIDREVKIYKAMLDSADTLSGVTLWDDTEIWDDSEVWNDGAALEPILIFEGRMDQPVISEDPESGQSTVSVSVANQFVDWERSQYRTTNHENQQIFFPGDKGFEFASEVNEEISWGRIPTP